MAKPPIRKRPRPKERSQDHQLSHDHELSQNPQLSQDQPPPAKRVKSSGRQRSNFPPEFWDNLSKLWLEPRALRELDRRNNLQPLSKPTPAEPYATDLARFARHGGPDLQDLRGYPEPKSDNHIMGSSRPSQSSSSSQSRQTQAGTQSTNATSAPASSTSGRSSAYNKNFNSHLIQHGIYPEGYEHADGRSTPEPDNLDQIHQELLAARASLSPSQFPESAFRDFKKKNTRVILEGHVMTSVIPVLCGNRANNIPSEQNVLFTELAPMTTKDATTKPKPDFFDGANLQDIDRNIRDEQDEQNLYALIVPTKHPTMPVAPNFFLEAKSPSGGADVARRQACYDGAYGARAMHALQNYGREDGEEPIYDDKAYTHSSTYHPGTGSLQLYSHHVTAPTTPGGQPEYHMTKIKGWDMTSDRQAFVEGARGLRNLRELAMRQRDSHIATANAMARQRVAPAQDNPSDLVQPDEEVLSPSEFVDCEEYCYPEDVPTDHHQHQDAIDSGNYAASQGNVEAPTLIPEYLLVHEDSQWEPGHQQQQQEEEEEEESASLDAIIDDPASFATSFAATPTPSFSTRTSDTTTARPKRPRTSSHSPPPRSQQPKEPAKGAKPASSASHGGEGKKKTKTRGDEAKGSGSGKGKGQKAPKGGRQK